MELHPRLLHISHEAVRPIGGVGVQIRNLIKAQKIRNVFHNNITLAGPLFFPEEGDCRTVSNLKTLEVLKSTLYDTHRIYPPRNGDDSTLVERLKNIELAFDVFIYYYRIFPHNSEWGTDILLIDHSSSFGQSFIQSRFFNEIVSRMNLKTGSNLYQLNIHPQQTKLGELVRNELLNNSHTYEVTKELREEMEKPITRMQEYRDYDYILGLLIAQPLALAIDSIYRDNDQMLVVANDYFSLPSLHFIKKESNQSCKTMLYITEINPARHLVEQKVPDPSMLGSTKSLNNKNITIGDARFYGAMKKSDETGKDMTQAFKEIASLYKSAADFYEEQSKSENPARTRYAQNLWLCQQAIKDLDISDHSSARIFYLAQYVDILAANGINSKRELIWLNPKCRESQSNFHVIPHGIEIDSIYLEDPQSEKIKAKHEIIQRINQTSGIYVADGEINKGRFFIDMNSKEHLFIKISRPVPCKAFDRDILVCQFIDDNLQENQEKANFLIISSWDDSQPNNPIYDWIKLAKKSGIRNISFFFVNQFDWPDDLNSRRQSVDRKQLFLASDVSFSQSRYESFGLSQIEPLQYGVICIMSGVSGASSCLSSEVISDIESPVIITNYQEQELEKSLIHTFMKDIERSEIDKAELIAQEVYKRLKNVESKTLYKKGREIAKSFEWEEVAQLFLNATGYLENSLK